MDVNATAGARVSGPSPVPPPAAEPTVPVPRRGAEGRAAVPEPVERGARSNLAALKPALSSADVGARFAIDDATKRVIVTMYDRRTGEVLREIPPPELRGMLAAGQGRGIVVDAER